MPLMCHREQAWAKQSVWQLYISAHLTRSINHMQPTSADCTFLDLFTADGPGIMISEGAVSLSSCRFERCRAFSAVIDVSEQRLRAEAVVFEDNYASRDISVKNALGAVYANPRLQVLLQIINNNNSLRLSRCSICAHVCLHVHGPNNADFLPP